MTTKKKQSEEDNMKLSIVWDDEMKSTAAKIEARIVGLTYIVAFSSFATLVTMVATLLK